MKSLNIQEVKSMIRAIAEESKLEIPADFHVIAVSSNCNVEMITAKGSRDQVQYVVNVPPVIVQFYEEVPFRMRVGTLALITRLLSLTHTKVMVSSPVTNSVMYQGKVYTNLRRLVENGFIPPWVVACSRKIKEQFEDPTDDDVAVYNDLVAKVAIHFSDVVMPDVVDPYPVVIKDFDAFVSSGKFEPVDESIFIKKMQE